MPWWQGATYHGQEVIVIWDSVKSVLILRSTEYAHSMLTGEVRYILVLKCQQILPDDEIKRETGSTANRIRVAHAHMLIVFKFNVYGSVHRNNILVYNSNYMHQSQSLFNLITALHFSGVTITHLQEHKITASTAPGNHYTVLLSAAIVEKLELIWVCCG
jgi:hypothetical protein